MHTPRQRVSLEEQINQWRNYLRRRQAIHSVDTSDMWAFSDKTARGFKDLLTTAVA